MSVILDALASSSQDCMVSTSEYKPLLLTFLQRSSPRRPANEKRRFSRRRRRAMGSWPSGNAVWNDPCSFTSHRKAHHSCRGYIGDSEATDQTFAEGWIKTGDILKMDENQNFWVTDRLKEVLESLLPSKVIHKIWLTTDYHELDDQVQRVR